MSRSRLYKATNPMKKKQKSRKQTIPGSRKQVGGIQGCCNAANCCQFDMEEIDEAPLPSGLKQDKKKATTSKKTTRADAASSKVRVLLKN